MALGYLFLREQVYNPVLAFADQNAGSPPDPAESFKEWMEKTIRVTIIGGDIDIRHLYLHYERYCRLQRLPALDASKFRTSLDIAVRSKGGRMWITPGGDELITAWWR